MILATLAARVVHADTTERVSVDGAGSQGDNTSQAPAISSDGRLVAFASLASDLVPGDTNATWDIFVHDRETGVTERISVNSFGEQANAGSFGPSISADGRFVAFWSDASNLVPNDTNGQSDVFVRDRMNGTTERVSVGASGIQALGGFSISPSISVTGRFVAFVSSATNLVSGDTNGKVDVFVRDRLIETTERISVNDFGIQGDGHSDHPPSISGDGRFIAFASLSSNLVPGDSNDVRDVFVRDRENGTTRRVSVDSSGAQGNSWSEFPAMTADGRFIVFQSNAANLVAGDTNGVMDIFIHDSVSQTTERISLNARGAEADDWSGLPAVTLDGRFVVFYSIASNLVPGDGNNAPDVFIRDRQIGLTGRLSVDSHGRQGNGFSWSPSITPDGAFVAFSSVATNLVPGDTNSVEDVFVRVRTARPGGRPF